jgi:cytidyltransferase-like protein
MKRGIVSGYFNPVHRGHLEYIHAAKEQVDYLIVIVNSDAQVKIKGSKSFMDETHRLYVMANIKGVDSVRIAIDKDKTVADTILAIKKDYPNDDVFFFNSGDRVNPDINKEESKERRICRENNIKYVAIPLPKIYSSSELIANASKA